MSKTARINYTQELKCQICYAKNDIIIVQPPMLCRPCYENHWKPTIWHYDQQHNHEQALAELEAAPEPEAKPEPSHVVAPRCPKKDCYGFLGETYTIGEPTCSMCGTHYIVQQAAKWPNGEQPKPNGFSQQLRNFCANSERAYNPLNKAADRIDFLTAEATRLHGCLSKLDRKYKIVKGQLNSQDKQLNVNDEEIEALETVLKNIVGTGESNGS